jgi:ribosomal protein S18 acetylase RimI-like enzyme
MLVRYASQGSMRIEIETSPSEQTLAAVRAGMRRYTESRVPWDEYSDLTLIARGDDGEVIAAALGETGRGWLNVSVVWVDERARGQRLGTQLVNAMEAEAIRRGCHSAYLDTFSYQARPFYEKLGYEVFGTLENYPPGHQRFYMRKRLGEA